MSNQRTQPADNTFGIGLKHKLMIVVVVAIVVPMLLLIATAASSMYTFPVMIAAIVVQFIGLMVAKVLLPGIIKQTRAINEMVDEVNNGNSYARADVFSSDELGQLAVAVNRLCEKSAGASGNASSQAASVVSASPVVPTAPIPTPSTSGVVALGDEKQVQASIESLISEMKQIADGNLTIQAAVNDDMTGSIATSVNHMTEQLRSIVCQVQSAAAEVTQSSSQIQATSTAVSLESDAQANRIGEAASQLAEMTETFEKVALLTKESVEVAVEARQTASNGLKAVSDTVDGMQRIRNQVQSTSKRIKRLGESSQEIGEITQLISDITDRTSILALNASIQASMAGDAGQGFAVIAEEIERLAERGTDATKQITKLIGAIQNETGEVISDMEESTREVVAGSQLATQAGETLFEIDSVSNQLVDLIQSSNASATQQANMVNEIANNMSEISNLTKDSAAKSRESTQSVGKLANMVGQLSDSVSKFRVTNNAAANPGTSNSFLSNDSMPQERTLEPTPATLPPTPMFSGADQPAQRTVTPTHNNEPQQRTTTPTDVATEPKDHSLDSLLSDSSLNATPLFGGSAPAGIESKDSTSERTVSKTMVQTDMEPDEDSHNIIRNSQPTMMMPESDDVAAMEQVDSEPSKESSSNFFSRQSPPTMMMQEDLEDVLPLSSEQLEAKRTEEEIMRRLREATAQAQGKQ